MLILYRILIINYMMIVMMKLLLHLYIIKNKKIFKVIKYNKFNKKINFRSLIVKTNIINKSIIKMLQFIKKHTMNFFKNLMTYSNIKNNIIIMMLSILNYTSQKKHICRVNKMSSKFLFNSNNNYQIFNMKIKEYFQKQILKRNMD
jgi:hypothetical protein